MRSAVFALLLSAAAGALASDASVILFRHATAPGIGDPAHMRLGDCSTQRNLDRQGRTQARHIGEQLRQMGVPVRAVWTSQWCRTRETAALAFPQLRPVEQPAFNSFFGDPSGADEQTAQARTLLQGWRGPGVLVVSTHQVNIAALTGISPHTGEGIVVRPTAAGLQVLGRIPAPAPAPVPADAHDSISKITRKKHHN
ncbi:MAG: histidine phosphatase family protein [Sphaerotilus sp.]|nr:histidine phosphatase family protein [Sphaerotilus sp.]